MVELSLDFKVLHIFVTQKICSLAQGHSKICIFLLPALVHFNYKIIIVEGGGAVIEEPI